MKIVSKGELSLQQKEIICELWNSEYPEKLSYKSVVEFENYLNNLYDLKHYLLKDELDVIHGWGITFDRENEKWFAIIVSSKIQSKGFGTQFLNHLKTIEPKLSGWVIDHNNDLKFDNTTYASPLDFYLKNGFTVCKEIRIESEKISAVKIVWN